MTNGPVHNYLIWTALLVGELMTPALGPVWTPGAQVAGFIKRISEHCYTRNIFVCFLPRQIKFYRRVFDLQWCARKNKQTRICIYKSLKYTLVFLLLMVLVSDNVKNN